MASMLDTFTPEDAAREMAQDHLLSPVAIIERQIKELEKALKSDKTQQVAGDATVNQAKQRGIAAAAQLVHILS